MKKLCQNLTREESKKLYEQVLIDNDLKAMRDLCLNDLFFLLLIAFKRRDIDNAWLYERIREVENEPNGFLDLWAREHYKSTIITYALTIKDILNNPNITIGIFSHTRPIAKKFLNQIKVELEENKFLQALFPDILYENPKTDSPKWSLDSGIVVKRAQNPKEATVEGWGLVDGQPTSVHFKLQIYDDIVTKESVTTPEQIKKTNEALELSYDLGSQNGKRRFIGTRYHSNDSYKMIMDRGSVKARIYPATSNGKIDGEPVLLTKERLREKRRDQGPYTFSCQQLLNPVADKAMGFKEEWVKFYDILSDTKNWNKYLITDPASKKKKTNDYTVMLVIGLAPDNNYYLIDGIRDRMNLTQRTDKLFEYHQKYNPNGTGYEQYGMQSDIEHIQYVMEQRNYRFNIIPLGGQTAKEDRILKLVPPFEQGRVYLPKHLTFYSYENVLIDLVKSFIDEEFLFFPVSKHDDMLDCFARIIDPALNAQFPKIIQPKPKKFMSNGRSGSWMG